jgi:hypothetical protein
MATAFLAMNDTYGPIFGVRLPKPPSRIAPTISEDAFRPVHHGHAHALLAGTKIMTFVNQLWAVGKAGWNGLANKEQTELTT